MSGNWGAARAISADRPGRFCGAKREVRPANIVLVLVVHWLSSNWLNNNNFFFLLAAAGSDDCNEAEDGDCFDVLGHLSLLFWSDESLAGLIPTPSSHTLGVTEM